MYSKFLLIMLLLLPSLIAFFSGCGELDGLTSTSVRVEIRFLTNISQGQYSILTEITAPDMDTITKTQNLTVQEDLEKIYITVEDVPPGDNRNVKVEISKDGEVIYEAATNTDVQEDSYNPLILNVAPAGHALIADFDLKTSDVKVGELVYVDADESYDTHYDIEVKWDWGDGNITDFGQQLTATHVYSKEGDYTIALTVRNEIGNESSKTQNVRVTGTSTTSKFLVSTKNGLFMIDSDGKMGNAITTDSWRVETYNKRIFVLSNDGRSIIEYNEQGNKLKTISISYCVNFTVIPNSGFALLDNVNDKIYFVDFNGNSLRTVNILKQKDNHLQSLSGIVVGNSLIVSQDGNNRILEVDLKSYDVSVFKDLTNLAGWLGAIDYNNGVYYLCQAKDIYSFREGQAEKRISILSEGNITGIVVVDNSAYVTINFSGEIYKVNTSTGEAE